MQVIVKFYFSLFLLRRNENVLKNKINFKLSNLKYIYIYIQFSIKYSQIFRCCFIMKTKQSKKHIVFHDVIDFILVLKELRVVYLRNFSLNAKIHLRCYVFLTLNNFLGKCLSHSRLKNSSSSSKCYLIRINRKSSL